MAVPEGWVMMGTILVGTSCGCRAFRDSVEGEVELAGREISALSREVGGACLAVVDARQVWRRDPSGAWSKVATVDVGLQCVAGVGDAIYCGAMEEAALFRVCAGGEPERLRGFDRVPGREGWFAGGPPLGVRSLAVVEDGMGILAGVHVGGIPRSGDSGDTWAPTVPVMFDIHEVSGHPSLPNFVAAAAAVGLCVSGDGGRTWKVISEGLEVTNSLAVAVLEGEVLFSIQEGPFAARSQLWRWVLGAEGVEQVRDGLPAWFEGKVDTGHIAAGGGCAAVLDGGGNLWRSGDFGGGWGRIAGGLPYSFGLVIV